MAVSVGWQVEQDSWSAGIRRRYSRAVEFVPATQSYALVEARELAPAASFRILALGRAARVVVRRTGYAAWEGALFAPPSGWLFFDRPNRADEAQQLAPGTAVTLSNETRLFVGANVATDVGALPLRVRAGAFASGEYFVRLERLPGGLERSDPREWVVSVGGLIPRGFNSAMNLRTPDLLWGKRLRIVEAHWRLPTHLNRNPMYVLRRNVDERKQLNIDHTEIALRIRRGHSPLVRTERMNLAPIDGVSKWRLGQTAIDEPRSLSS